MDRSRTTQEEELTMVMHLHETAPLGEVVAAVFDEAALQASDRAEVSRLATQAVMNLLRRSRGLRGPRALLDARRPTGRPWAEAPRG